MPKKREIRIVLSSVMGVFQRVVQLVASLVTLPLVLHSLGVAGFGVWGAATSLAALSSMLTMGLGSALMTLIPRAIASGKPQDSRAYVSAALGSGAVLAISILFFGSALICLHRSPGPAFVVAGVALALNIPLNISTEMWFALQKGYVAMVWQTIQTVLTFGLLLASAFSGAGVTLMVAAVYGAMLIANLGSLLHVLYQHPFLRPLPRFSPAALRAVLGQGGLLFCLTIAAACSYAFDNVMALAWLGAGAAAQMAVAIRVCSSATNMVSAATQPLWPGFAEALAEKDQAWVMRMIKAGVLAVLASSIAGAALLVAVGNPVVTWWLHKDLHLSTPLLWAMAAWIVASVLPQVPAALLLAAQAVKPQLILLAAVSLLGLALKFLAAQPFGVVGILAVSPVLWFVFVVPGYFFLASRALRKLA